MREPERADVFLWLARLASVEGDLLIYGWPPRPELADEYREAGDRCVARAAEILGHEVTGEDWDRAMEAWERRPRAFGEPPRDAAEQAEDDALIAEFWSRLGPLA